MSVFWTTPAWIWPLLLVGAAGAVIWTWRAYAGSRPPVRGVWRRVLPLLRAAGSAEDPARVINIGSMEGLHIPTVHGVGNYAYTASKAAVHHLTRHLAVELGARQITVNAIAPGFFPSRMTDHVFDNARQEIEHNCLLGRVGEPAEMAGIAVYLSSRAGAYTHGAVIPVDGGTSINHQHAPVVENGA